MSDKLSPEEKKLYKRTDEILHYMWDPIGVSGIPQARDEYQTYLPQVFKLLLNKNSNEEIAKYLNDIVENNMGLNKNHQASLEVAEILLDAREAIIENGF